MTKFLCLVCLKELSTKKTVINHLKNVHNESNSDSYTAFDCVSDVGNSSLEPEPPSEFGDIDTLIDQELIVMADKENDHMPNIPLFINEEEVTSSSSVLDCPIVLPVIPVAVSVSPVAVSVSPVIGPIRPSKKKGKQIKSKIKSKDFPYFKLLPNCFNNPKLGLMEQFSLYGSNNNKSDSTTNKSDSLEDESGCQSNRQGHTISQSDSCQADSHQGDSPQSDSHQGDSRQGDSPQGDSPQGDSHKGDCHQGDSHEHDSLSPENHSNNLQKDSFHTNSLLTDSIQIESIQTGTLQSDNHNSDTLQRDSLQRDSHILDIQGDNLQIYRGSFQEYIHQKDSLNNDSLQIDSLQNDNLQIYRGSFQQYIRQRDSFPSASFGPQSDTLNITDSNSSDTFTVPVITGVDSESYKKRTSGTFKPPYKQSKVSCGLVDCEFCTVKIDCGNCMYCKNKIKM